jgi:hypothetical protein
MKADEKQTTETTEHSSASLASSCWAVLSDRYKTYLDRHVAANLDPWTTSIQDCIFKPLRDEKFRLLQIGDGTGYDEVYVALPDGREEWIKRTDLHIIQGSIRTVYKRPKIFMGKTSLMGILAHGIKTGRTFRGR